MEDKKILEFNNKKYYLEVSTYDEPNHLKVSMIDIKTKEKEEITMDGVELVVPTAPTPDCVIINTKKHEKLVEKLLELKILDYCNTIFAKFNMGQLYKYDKEGTKSFLDDNTSKVEYEEHIGNSLEEVEKNIRKDVRKLLSEKEVKTKFDEAFMSTKLTFLYTLICEKNPKDSLSVYLDEEGQTFFLISPYLKGYNNKFEIVPEWMFSLTEGMLAFLERDYKLKGFNDLTANASLWLEIYESYPDIKYKKGLQRYQEYCKEKGITKEKLVKSNDWDKKDDDILQYYKPEKKKKNRAMER